MHVGNIGKHGYAKNKCVVVFVSGNAGGILGYRIEH
jgi:hypothetical protein